MKPYADYCYYVEEYDGNKVSGEEFDKHIRKASVYINEITHGRIQEGNLLEKGVYLNEIQDAACAVAEVIYEDDQQMIETGGRELKSENTDGYSVSYVTDHQDGETHEDTLRRKMYQAARGYLLHTGLLYLGVNGW